MLAPVGPVPTSRQLSWHARPFIGFLHFGPNTFTDKEWGFGDESPGLFSPTAFDAQQIVGAAADAGMSGLILTCKHHDGFCLWPSRYTEHSVKHSPWRGGQGDVVREISDACHDHGIGFGVYLSPWDRNHAQYGTPAYIEYFRNQLQELTTEYGPICEVWFDGANGGDGYYGGANETRTIDRLTYYDWPNTWEIVRQNQPDAVMFSDAGPDVRWVGNEKGIAGDPCWSTINKNLLSVGIDDEHFRTMLTDDMVEAWGSPRELLNQGDRNGADWLPAECDVSIRPGWFYHAHEDDAVRTPDNLMDLYFQSVGRGATLLLNLPPDQRGLIHENDIASLRGFRQQRDQLFADNAIELATDAPSRLTDGDGSTYWLADESSQLVIEFDQPIRFDVLALAEHLPLGQRVDHFAVDVDRGGQWHTWCDEQAIGHRRLIRGELCTSTRLRLRITETRAPAAISALGLYRWPT
jgi:alpha-L-fucosidase